MQVKREKSTHEASSKLCSDGQEFVLEVLDHRLHATVEDIKVRLVGKLQQVCVDVKLALHHVYRSNLG